MARRLATAVALVAAPLAVAAGRALPQALARFGRSLGLDASATAGPEDTGRSSGPAIASTGVPQRPFLATVGDSIQALVPDAGGPASGDAGIPVRIVYTAGFLLTYHSGPCPALEHASPV